MLHVKGLKKRYKISRIIHIAIIIILSITIAKTWQSGIVEKQQALHQQEKILVDFVLNQITFVTEQTLIHKDNSQLKALVRDLVETPYIVSLAIYDHQGVKLVLGHDVNDIITTTQNAKKINQTLKNYPVFVKSIYENGKSLGYLEVHLKPKLIWHEFLNVDQIIEKQQQIMLIMATVIGALIARLFSRKRLHFDYKKSRIIAIRAMRKRRRQEMKKRNKNKIDRCN